ncbi:hypothetical protein [Nannocystis punicea]|uniref:Glutathione synthase n=1 Tax=Nannocystis punicea TaxID=2995304 RepID=A0ABY7H6N4_9BACT|nr:hypothetical protein [Nannocystis poenicansa]WAS94757.1 hypothetical protein O0S08_01240 [Nannocystis poenicansa]
MPRYLVTADPVASFQPRFDTTLRLMAELLARDIEVDYCDLLTTDMSLGTDTWLATLPVRPVLWSDPTRPPYVGTGELRAAAALDYDVLVHRKDPPVDGRYRGWAERFAALDGRRLQINEPAEVLRHSEHLLPVRFPDCSIATVHCREFADLLAAVRAQPVEAVVKPIGECSGIGIAFFRPDAAEPVLLDWWQQYGEAVVQPYQDAVTTRGDLRILTIGYRILGSVTRLPRPGSRLANLHQGASFHAFDPTPRQLEAVAAVTAELVPRGLYLLGLDFIGDLLSEINFTSPSAMVQIGEVMHKRPEVELVDELEALRSGFVARAIVPASAPA